MPERDRIGAVEDFAESIAGMHERVVVGGDRRRQFESPKTYKAQTHGIEIDALYAPSPAPSNPTAEAVRLYERSDWARPCGEFRPKRGLNLPIRFKGKAAR